MEIQFQSDIGKRRNMNQDYANVFTNQAGMYLASTSVASVLSIKHFSEWAYPIEALYTSRVPEMRELYEGTTLKYILFRVALWSK